MVAHGPEGGQFGQSRQPDVVAGHGIELRTVDKVVVELPAVGPHGDQIVRLTIEVEVAAVRIVHEHPVGLPLPQSVEEGNGPVQRIPLPAVGERIAAPVIQVAPLQVGVPGLIAQAVEPLLPIGPKLQPHLVQPLHQGKAAVEGGGVVVQHLPGVVRDLYGGTGPVDAYPQ